MKPAISTVACPDRTLHQIVALARTLDITGLELRTFGDDSAHFAADPCLTSFPKTRELLRDAGIDPACLATSIRYDEPIFPPIIGRVTGQTDTAVRATRRMIRVAAQLECPFVRVFAFELPGNESRRSGLRRIVERLTLAAACARNTGVRLLLENGGSFPTGEDLAEIIDRVGSPLISAAYSPAVAQAVGEDPIRALRTLAGRLESVKLKDFQGTRAVPIGQGEMRCRETVEELARAGYTGWVVIEWDRLWLPDLAPAEAALPPMIDDLFRWMVRDQPAGAHALA
jgi:sugar phosphate isomerase/epimerase